VLLVLTIVAAAALASFVASSRLGRTAAGQSERLGATRTTAALLAIEMRPLVPGHDGLAVAQDSASFRVFRGRGIVCAVTASHASMRYRGWRAPDPAKDSLLVLASALPERAVPIASASAVPLPACMPLPGEQTYNVAPPTGLLAGDVVLVFERGAYHLSGAALRYRRGAGGRQPVTGDAFFDDSTRFGVDALARRRAAPPETVALRLRLAPIVPNGSPTVPWPDVRIPILNARVPIDSTAAQP
jgi:hypothetical protein